MKNSDLTFLILPVWKPFLHLIFQIILLKVQIITDYKPHKHTVQSERDTTAILPMCYTGIMLSDNMLNLMALRYAASSGHMTLESFISLILRLECMHSKWSRVGRTMLTVTKVKGCVHRISQFKTVAHWPFVLLNRHLQAVVGWR